MKLVSIFKISLLVAAMLSLSACIVAPIAPPQPAYQTPQPVAVEPVAPAPYYAAPAVGYIWLFNPVYGWGWRHPRHGWHRGWH